MDAGSTIRTTEPSARPAYRIAPMEPRHGEAVGRLHAEQIEHSHMTGLGPVFLGRLYEELTSSGFGFGFVVLRDDGAAAAEKGTVVAFIYGRMLPSPSMVRVVLGSWRRLLPPLLPMPLTRPSAFFRTIQAMRQSNETVGGSADGEWLALALLPEVRGGEHGRALVDALFDEFAARGCRRLRWAAHGDNAPILRFFEKMSAVPVGETRISGRSILWFELELASR